MAMTTAARGGAIAAINVTPMADVMIVLLIIFMVATPLIGEGRVRKLPAAETVAEKKQERTEVWLTADHSTYLGGNRLASIADLLPRLRERLDARPEAERVVHVKADADLPYAEVRRVLDLCREAGAEQVALIARRRVRG
jgi:biopolymer transport protein ExbD